MARDRWAGSLPLFLLVNPTTNPNNPSLYDLSNAILGTKLEKKKKKPKRHELAKMSRKEIEEYEELIFAWANYPLSWRQIQYAALDSRMGFEIARTSCVLVCYMHFYFSCTSVARTSCVLVCYMHFYFSCKNKLCISVLCAFLFQLY